MIIEDGSWNLDLFRVWLPEDVVQRIRAIPPPSSSDGPDKITWCHTSFGSFSVKSAYRALKGDIWDMEDDKWKSVLKAPGPHKVRFFIWLVLKQ